MATQLGFQLISSQPQYSMLWRVIESEVVPACEDLGLSQIVWSPMAGGILTGKYLPGQQPPEGSRGADESGSRTMSGKMTDEVLTAVQKLRPIAEGLGTTMGQLAIAWVLSNPNVAGAIVGASRPEQIAENVKALDLTLDDATLGAIDAAIGHVVTDDPTLSPFPRLAWPEPPGL